SLFGSLSVQISFPNDTHFKKYPVYTVYTIELAQTILSTHDAFATFGYDFTDAAAISKVRFTPIAVAIMAGMVAFIIQSFYAYRIYLFSNTWFTPAVIVV
ncbi:hypothetical protein C8J57DRAFT_1023707, partial [Mycena rebaudengoi]